MSSKEANNQANKMPYEDLLRRIEDEEQPLTDEDLEQIAGGWGGSNECPDGKHVFQTTYLPRLKINYDTCVICGYGKKSDKRYINR